MRARPLGQYVSVREPPDTRLLRADDEPVYSRLRVLVAELGMDPDAVALAEFFADDCHAFFGIIATPAGQVYEFVFYLGSGDIAAQISTGTLSELTDTTTLWRDRPFSDSVERALTSLGRQP